MSVVGESHVLRCAGRKRLLADEEVPLPAVGLLVHFDGLRAAVPIDCVRRPRGPITALRVPAVHVVVAGGGDVRPPLRPPRGAVGSTGVAVVAAVLVAGRCARGP